MSVLFGCVENVFHFQQELGMSRWTLLMKIWPHFSTRENLWHKKTEPFIMGNFQIYFTKLQNIFEFPKRWFLKDSLEQLQRKPHHAWTRTMTLWRILDSFQINNDCTIIVYVYTNREVNLWATTSRSSRMETGLIHPVRTVLWKAWLFVGCKDAIMWIFGICNHPRVENCMELQYVSQKERLCPKLQKMGYFSTIPGTVT